MSETSRIRDLLQAAPGPVCRPGRVGGVLPLRVARSLSALVLAVVGIAMLPASPAEAHGPKVWWVHAYPFGASAEDALAWGTTRGAKKRIMLAAGASSAYDVRGLKWKGWGHKRAVGHGKVRYCDDTCTPWRPAKVVLTKPQKIDCYHGADADKRDVHRVYRASRVWGFEYLADGFQSRAPRGSAQC